MSNSFGHHFRIHTFGESHGPAMGVLIDGCPAGVFFDEDLLVKDLMRRRPGLSAEMAANSVVSPRKEEDKAEVLSGVYQGVTLGTPIAIVIRNQDARSEDYHNLPPRIGHADDVWLKKFSVSDPRGGGRSSGRETVARVAAAAVAKMYLKQTKSEVQIFAFAKKIGEFELSNSEIEQQLKINQGHNITDAIDQYSARFFSPRHLEVQKFLQDIQNKNESVGGVVQLHIRGLPAGLGQPVFHKLKSDLASALMGIGAATAVEMGAGIEASNSPGTTFHQTDTANYGGIRGGISTGEEVIFRLHFKPTSSILQIAKAGRHDPCIVPRAVPVVEAMANLVIADHFMWQKMDRLV